MVWLGVGGPEKKRLLVRLVPVPAAQGISLAQSQKMSQILAADPVQDNLARLFPVPAIGLEVGVARSTTAKAVDLVQMRMRVLSASVMKYLSCCLISKNVIDPA